jgi:HAD superfamily hydrolase (TIGR01549 family)
MKAVLWDLDDTILNTLPARMISLKHAYEVCVGGWVDPLELWKSHRGHSLEALGQRLLGEDYRRFAETYRTHYYRQADRAPAFPGVEAVLQACRESELKLGIVTSKISWGATDELEQAGLLHYFGAVVGSDDTDTQKPDPAPVFEAMNRLIIDDVAEVVFIGDSPADMFAARNAGCTAIAALWGTLDSELLLDAGPTHTAETPAQVAELLVRIARGIA